MIDEFKDSFAIHGGLFKEPIKSGWKHFDFTPKGSAHHYSTMKNKAREIMIDFNIDDFLRLASKAPSVEQGSRDYIVNHLKAADCSVMFHSFLPAKMTMEN